MNRDKDTQKDGKYHAPTISLKHRQFSDPSSDPLDFFSDKNIKVERKYGHRKRAQSIFCTDSSLLPSCQSPAANFLSTLKTKWNQSNYDDKFMYDTVLQDGDIVDRYKLGRLLGRGGFCECRAAVHMDTDIEYALKIASPTSPSAVHAFERELKIWSGLCHPSILTLVDYFRCTEGTLVAVSPLVQPGSLFAFLAEEKNGKLSPSEVNTIFKQVCTAIEYLHTEAKIVHRDIKLENILIDQELNVFLCDFGLSIDLENYPYLDSDGFAMDGNNAQGSLWYLPPEDIRPEPFTPSFEDRCKSDVWCLGIVLYALLTGSLPFTDDFFPRLQTSILNGIYPKLPSTVNNEMERLVNAMLRPKPEDRPFVRQILQDLLS